MELRTIAWTRLDGVVLGMDARSVHEVVEQCEPAGAGEPSLDLAEYLALTPPSGMRRGFRLLAEAQPVSVWAGSEVWLAEHTEPIFDLPALLARLGTHFGIAGVTAVGARFGYVLQADLLWRKALGSTASLPNQFELGAAGGCESKQRGPGR